MALALESIRWEAPTDDEFVRSVATALQSFGGLRAIELCIEPPETTLVVLHGKRPRFRATEASRPAQRKRTRRPKGGWGPDGRGPVGAEVGATEVVEVPLGCRHTDASVVLWTSRARMTDESVDVLAAGLALAVDARVLLHRVAKLSRSAYSDNRRLRRALRDSVAPNPTMRSPAMRRCLERVHAVAPFSTPVLVTGPSGAGKEVLARRIHVLSSRSTKPFIKLNCGAIPESLAESELFGHQRGAFTGATKDHKGVFERAAGGTLLLDEVGELSAPTQVKLLRVLQEGTFTPLGSERERHSDARVIAATHRDLAERVRNGEFREDLFYRLAVFEVRVPSLVERPEDFPHLVRQILGRLAERMGRLPLSVPRQVMTRLAAHDWPGNVRELECALEGALVMSESGRLQLPLLLERGTRRTGMVTSVEPLEAIVRGAIEAALRESKGKIYGDGGAAEMLGLKPGTLQSKMRKLGINRAEFIR